MNELLFVKGFPRQLRFWALHCTLNALPSLAIALGWLGLWQSPVAVIAMVSGILSFIFLYAVVTSVMSVFTDGDGVLSRSLKLGTKIRSWISGVSLLAVATGVGAFYTPDFWCGFGASAVVKALRILATTGRLPSNFSPAPPRSADATFWVIYSTTMLEGLLLSLLLVMLSFFCVILIQRRDRRRTFDAGTFVPEGGS